MIELKGDLIQHIYCMTLFQFMELGQMYAFPLMIESIKLRLDVVPFPETNVLVYFEGQKVIGVLAYDKYTHGRYWVAPLEVREERRNEGIGTKLLDQFKWNLVYHGFSRVELSCRKEVLEWWKRRGFETYRKDGPFYWMEWETKRTREFYTMNGDQRIVLP